VRCPKCGAESASTAQLCYNCNAELAGPPAAVAEREVSSRQGAPAAVAAEYGQGVAYDPQVIKGFAQAMYARATMVTVSYALSGAVGGGAVLGIAGGLGGSATAGFILGALVGGVFGYFVGNMQANALRLGAQLALCQVEIERNTRPA